MGVTLESLQALQQVELKLLALRSKIHSKQRSVRVHQKKISTLEAELTAHHEAVLRQESSIAQLELEVKAREEEIVKLREALNRSKTNKEYAAILSQINTSKADNTKIEDRILALMGDLETLKAEEQSIKDNIALERQILENARAEAGSFESRSEQELQVLERQRREAASAVPSETLNIFERVAERHDGEAMARVVQPHPKRQEFICEGCNMTLTLEQYVALQGSDQIQLCHNCGRVLFVDAKSV